MNEKFCALRIANALQSHRKGRIYCAEPDQTAEAQGAVNSNPAKASEGRTVAKPQKAGMILQMITKRKEHGGIYYVT
ncbi:hypothetical protein C0033_09700 [Clostridium sp. chh4-2]|nr:hypothetical protein C0033_09700 [Clostridium sp. chh4-2]